MPNTRRKAASGPPERDDSSIDHTISKFKVDMGYRMDYHDGHERIGHGQLLINNCWVNVSFLLCSSIKEQKQIFGNLSSVQHPSMVRVFLPLPEGVRMGGKELYPIAIERVSSTLNAFLDRYKQNIWKYGNLNSTSQQIARDMIDGMIFIHGKNKIHGRKTEDGITALDFVMVGDKVKFALFMRRTK